MINVILKEKNIICTSIWFLNHLIGVEEIKMKILFFKNDKEMFLFNH